MGFPDNYTDLQKAKRTNRYQAIGNSWAVPVVHWIGERLVNYTGQTFYLDITSLALSGKTTVVENEGFFIDCGKDTLALSNGIVMNCTPIPENCTFADMSSVVSSDAPEEIYISPVGCYGIVRRKQERNLRINQRLEEVLLNISSQMTPEEIEKRSRVQKRGRFSEPQADDDTTTKVFIPFPQEVKQKEKTELEQQEARQMSIFNFV